MSQSQVCQGQIKRDRYLSDYVFKGNHIQFAFAALSASPARLTEKLGDYPISTNRSLGINLSIHYKVNISNAFSVSAGVESMILGSNIEISFDKNGFSPALIKDYNIKGIYSYIPATIIGLPLLASRRIVVNSGFGFVEAGMKANIGTGADGSTLNIYLERVNGTSVGGGKVSVNLNNDRRLWLSLISSAGYSWLLRNNNLLGLALTTNLSFAKFVQGNYTMHPTDLTTIRGNYTCSGSYLGVSLHYTFTNANHRIRKAIEKQARH